MEKCNHCNEVITMTFLDIPAVRNTNGSAVLIKQVPMKKCGCDSAVTFRVGLEMSYYKENDLSEYGEIEYAFIAEQLKGLSNTDLIDPTGKLG
ncbi:hypothetical protein ACFPOG_12560 [Paenibacillus aestuarii]|uniref:YgiT-type zinc finger protein n=1 Tax=Paenibacillus aestuarii TaxID=516965 RepID=A0ABW0K8B7_9BACL